MGIGDCLPIIGAIFADVSEVSVGEFGVEQVERCMPRM